MWALLCCADARAQYAPAHGFRLDRWVSTPTSRDGFAVTRPSVLEHGVWSVKMVGSYAANPLVLRSPQAQAVVAHRMGAELTAAVGLWDMLELYGRVPVTLFSLGEDVVYQQTIFEAPRGMAFSDIAFGATALALETRGFSLGGRAELVTPSGNRGQLAGDSALAPRVHGLAEFAHGPVAFVANAGFVYRPPRDYALARIGRELEFGALVRFDAGRGVEMLLEAFGSRGLRARSGPSAADTFDLLLGARHTADTGAVRMRSGLAVGTGLSAALGDPDFRSLFSLALEPRPARPARAAVVLDSDHDGIPDERDECPSESEDLDGFDDHDGCPDDDNDGDQVLDAVDRCPLEPGDPVHGCPLADADGDGIPDEQDRCPEDPENWNGERDEDGCPERDLDGDGLDDDADHCPDVAGPPEQAGCPSHARFSGEQIALLTPVRFAGTGLAEEAAPVLDDLAALLRARPHLGAEIAVFEPDLSLAGARAEALTAALVARGIAAERLSPRAAAPEAEAPAEHVRITLRLAR